LTVTDPLGLFGFEDLGSWFDQVTTGAYHGLKSGPGVAITSFVVGFGDSITFGLSETVREALAPGSSCQVVKDGFYSAGSIAAMFVPIPGVGLASAAAKTGALAVAGAVTVVVKATPAVVTAAKAAPKALVGRTVLAAKVTSEGRTGSQAVFGANSASRIGANQAAGDAARDSVAAGHPGALIEQTFSTALGPRRVDVMTQTGIGIESKVGRTSLTATTQAQIAKDQWLMANNKDVAGIQWFFSRSGVTGQIGPTGPLADALTRARIPWGGAQ
jgi:hypothetical protein